jgi:hypothetical protein
MGTSGNGQIATMLLKKHVWIFLRKTFDDRKHGIQLAGTCKAAFWVRS